VVSRLKFARFDVLHFNYPQFNEFTYPLDFCRNYKMDGDDAPGHLMELNFHLYYFGSQFRTRS